MLVVIVRRISKRWFQFLVFLPLLLLKFFRALWLQQIHEKSVYIRVVLLPSQSLLISEVLLMQLLFLTAHFITYPLFSFCMWLLNLTSV